MQLAQVIDDRFVKWPIELDPGMLTFDPAHDPAQAIEPLRPNHDTQADRDGGMLVARRQPCGEMSDI